MKYIEKPIVVEAFKWTGALDQIEDPVWISEAIKEGTVFFSEDGLLSIKTLAGTIVANPGDYIIKGIGFAGEIYTCKESFFECYYEPSQSPYDGKSNAAHIVREWQGADTCFVARLYKGDSENVHATADYSGNLINVPYALVVLASLVTEQQNNDAERETFITGVADLMRSNLMWG